MKPGFFDKLPPEIRECYAKAQAQRDPYGVIDHPRGLMLVGAVTKRIGDEPQKHIEVEGHSFWYVVNCSKRPVAFEYHATSQDGRFAWRDPAPDTQAQRVVIQGTIGAMSVGGTPDYLPFSRAFRVSSTGYTSVFTECQFNNSHCCRFKFVSDAVSRTPVIVSTKSGGDMPLSPPVQAVGSSTSATSLSPTLREPMTSLKTVVEVDLVGYSVIARALEENTSADVVMAFNDQIQQFVDRALMSVNLSRQDVVAATTGDGAILLFDLASAAHSFAVALHMLSNEHNQKRSVPSAHRTFRIGIATGNIAMSGGQIAGTTIANAVRLETACYPGGIVADEPSFAAFSESTKLQYGDAEHVTGKNGEVLTARRFPIGHRRTSSEESPSVADVLDAFDRLYPRSLITRVMLLVRMPKDHRPKELLTYAQQQDAVIDWVADQKDGLLLLYRVLKDLSDKQGR